MGQAHAVVVLTKGRGLQAEGGAGVVQMVRGVAQEVRGAVQGVRVMVRGWHWRWTAEGWLARGSRGVVTQ